MNTDFSKHQTLINSFRGQVNKSNFAEKFSANTNKLAKTESFLLKMELKRLATACTRSIDLRGLVDGNCNVYEHQGQNHFLDSVAIKAFEENVELYGAYTFGVYEAVKNTENNFRVIYQKEQAGIKQPAVETIKKAPEKLQCPAKLYQFADYFDRIEERMNFAINLIITLENNQQIPATSSDLSVNGCKFRVTEQSLLAIGDMISIKFTGLEQEFQFGSSDVFTFQVKNSHQDGDTQLLGCQRIDAPEKDAFKRFLHAYIQGNKRRYKVNLDNTIKALQARSYEQYILPKINELPVFVIQESKKLIPRYALTTNNNQAVFQYWQDEAGHSTLHCLLSEERLARLKAQKTQQKSLLVYSFIHQHQGKSFFYSLDEQQLPKNDAFFSAFLTFAANKASFAITELTCLGIDENSAYAPFTVANTQTIKNQYINLPPSDEVKSCLAPLPNIIVASDVTQLSFVEQYQQVSSEKIDTTKLKLYGHKRLKKPLVVDELGISYKNQRQELRFIYHTEAVVECEKVKWTGKSQDFSVSGLKIQLDSDAVLSMGDIVYLTFPNLQKITSAFDLKQLPYEVVRINKKKTIINLRVHVKEHQHIGRAFFKLLINKNRDKLTTDEYAMLTPGLSAALRTCYVKNMKIPTLVVQTSGSRYKIEVLASNDRDSELLQQMKRLSDRQRFYNLYPLLTKLQTNNALEQSLKTLLTNEDPITQLIYLAVNPNEKKVDKSVSVALDSELNTPELRQFFMKKALKRGQFYCLQLTISRTNEPDMEYLNTELSYISAYAIHRGKQIEQDIWSVVGVIQVFDVTKDALLSHGLATES
ncbi:PilZ domain-containing protein [Colwellia sp. 39_35_sub15_T18]|nr:PilZ domain-containing protein [Colwellia sp. 39_35_sub15_T18]